MTASLIEELRRMGIGWFILKYAEDHGVSIGSISTNYGKSRAMKTRLAAYNRTKNEHNIIIKALKASRLKKSVKAGNPVVDSCVLEGILGKL